MSLQLDPKLFLSVYGLIFLAELPDKTAVAILLMSSQGAPLALFLGVALAFLIQTIVSVAFGSAFAYFPATWIHWATGVLFLFFSWSTWRKRNEAPQTAETTAVQPFVKQFFLTAWRAFLIIFIAEWGDLTQLATASLVAKEPSKTATIFTAALLALWTTSAIAIVLGQILLRKLKPRLLRIAGSVVFAIMGCYFLLTAPKL